MENKKKKGFLDEFFIKNSMDLPFFLLLLLVLAIGLVMLLSSSYFYAFYKGTTSFVDETNPDKAYTPDGRIASVLHVN